MPSGSKFTFVSVTKAASLMNRSRGSSVMPSFRASIVSCESPLKVYMRRSWRFATSGDLPHTPNVEQPWPLLVCSHCQQNI